MTERTSRTFYVSQHLAPPYRPNGRSEWVDSVLNTARPVEHRTADKALSWYDEDPSRAHYRQRFDVRAVRRTITDEPGAVLPRLTQEGAANG